MPRHRCRKAAPDRFAGGGPGELRSQALRQRGPGGLKCGGERTFHPHPSCAFDVVPPHLKVSPTAFGSLWLLIETILEIKATGCSLQGYTAMRSRRAD